MSQTTQQPVCSWCDESLVFAPTGIGPFCNHACRKQHQRHPGFTKTSWAAARRGARQQRETARLEARKRRKQARQKDADAAFRSRNRDRSLAFDGRHAGPESSAGVNTTPGTHPYVPMNGWIA